MLFSWLLLQSSLNNMYIFWRYHCQTRSVQMLWKTSQGSVATTLTAVAATCNSWLSTGLTQVSKDILRCLIFFPEDLPVMFFLSPSSAIVKTSQVCRSEKSSWRSAEWFKAWCPTALQPGACGSPTGGLKVMKNLGLITFKPIT